MACILQSSEGKKREALSCKPVNDLAPSCCLCHLRSVTVENGSVPVFDHAVVSAVMLHELSCSYGSGFNFLGMHALSWTQLFVSTQCISLSFSYSVVQLSKCFSPRETCYYGMECFDAMHPMSEDD